MLRLRTVVLLLVAASLAGCGEEARRERPVTLVKTEVVHTEPRSTVIRLTGDVQARVSTELSFRVSGRVVERLVDVGAHVKAGDILARLDPTEQRADLVGAQAALTAAEAQLRLSTATFERQKSLMASGFTTRVAFDQAQEGLRAAEGSLDTAKAQLGIAKDALGYTELRASAAGIITARNIEVGQVAQSAQAAYTLAEDGARDAVFDVYEAIFLIPVSSDMIKVWLVSNPAVKAEAKLREVSPTVDPKTGSVRVKLSIENPPPEMTLGSALVGESYSRAVDKIVLPWSALTADQSGAAVWLVDPKTHEVSLKSVAIESYETDSVVIGGGLAVGDRVVIDGGKMLRPGQIVAEAGGAA